VDSDNFCCHPFVLSVIESIQYNFSFLFVLHDDHTKMNSQQISDAIESWAWAQNFTAPYGILTGSYTNQKGTKFLSITFGRARTLDATVEIYNRNFMILRTNRTGSEVFKNFSDLQQALNLL